MEFEFPGVVDQDIQTIDRKGNGVGKIRNIEAGATVETLQKPPYTIIRTGGRLLSNACHELGGDAKFPCARLDDIGDRHQLIQLRKHCIG